MVKKYAHLNVNHMVEYANSVISTVQNNIELSFEKNKELKTVNK